MGCSLWGCKELDTTEPLHFLSFSRDLPDPGTEPMSLQYPSLAAVAVKSLQLCPILCDPIDGCPQGFPVPGILQARILEWVATSFSNA